MMRKVLAGFVGFIGLIMVLVGCIRIDEYEMVRYKAPNWTSDGRIVFVKDYNFVRDKHGFWGVEGNIEGGKEILTLCEIDPDGRNLRQIVKLAESPNYARSLGITNTSSAGEWVAVAMNTLGVKHDEIFVVKRDGTGLKNLGEGSWPDLSSDGKKIVYQKPNQGLWIKNIDGGGDRQIVSEENALCPVWSPNSIKIVYGLPGNLGAVKIIDTTGAILKNYNISHPLSPDWASSPATLGLGNGLSGKVRFIDLLSDTVIETEIYTGGAFKWSPSGDHFIGYDETGYFVIKKDGSNKRYLKP